jgi:hypothetical protein
VCLCLPGPHALPFSPPPAPCLTQVVTGLCVAWGVGDGCQAYLPLPPPLPPVTHLPRHQRVITPRAVSVVLPCTVLTRVLLFLMEEQPPGGATGVDLPRPLLGPVSRAWWRAYVSAQRIWHGGVVGARWAAVRKVFGDPTTFKVALNVKAELKALRQLGVPVVGEVLDPLVRSTCLDGGSGGLPLLWQEKGVGL